MTQAADKVSPGQRWSPPTARLHNAWTDAAYANAPSQRFTSTRMFQHPQDLRVLVHATSTVDPGAAVGWGSMTAIPSTASQRQQKLIFPYATAAMNKWGIAPAGIRANTAMEVIISGATFALVNVTNTGHEFVDADGIGDLVSGETGYAKLMQLATTTGLQWLPVLLPFGGSGSVTDVCLYMKTHFPNYDIDIPQYVGHNQFESECRWIDVIACPDPKTILAAGNTDFNGSTSVLSVDAAGSLPSTGQLLTELKYTLLFYFPGDNNHGRVITITAAPGTAATSAVVTDTGGTEPITRLTAGQLSGTIDDWEVTSGPANDLYWEALNVGLRVEDDSAPPESDHVTLGILNMVSWTWSDGSNLTWSDGSDWTWSAP